MTKMYNCKLYNIWQKCPYIWLWKRCGYSLSRV